MAGDNVVEVRFGANTEELRRGAADATSAVDGIQARLKEFKSEAVSTGRQARFFANELAAIIPGADGAKAALRDLIAVGLSGSAIGAAIEGVKLIVALFHELGEEEGKAKEGAQKYGEDTGKILEDLTKRVDGLLLSWRHLGEAQTLVATDLKAAQDIEVKAAQAATDAQQKLADARVAAREGLASQKDAKDFGLLVEAAIRKPAEAYAKALAELQKAQDNIIAIKAKIAEAAKGEAGEAERKARLKELELEFADLKAMREAENLVSVALLNKDFDEREKIRQKEQEAQAKALQEEFDELRRVREEESLVDSKIATRDLARRQKDLASYVASVKHVADEISASFSRAFREIIDGTKSVGEALLDVLKGVAEMVVQALLSKVAEGVAALITAGIAHDADVTETEGNIAVAATGAASAVASIPFVGPALAIAAAHAVEADLQSLADPLLSAARGADLPAGGPFPMVAHSREMMLPEQYADVIRGLAGGGGGGGDVHVHVHSLYADAESLKKLPRDPHFRRGMLEARRLGEG